MKTYKKIEIDGKFFVEETDTEVRLFTLEEFEAMQVTKAETLASINDQIK